VSSLKIIYARLNFDVMPRPVSRRRFSPSPADSLITCTRNLQTRVMKKPAMLYVMQASRYKPNFTG